MKKKNILVLLSVLLLITAMACNITNLFSSDTDEAEEALSDLAIALTESAKENQAQEKPVEDQQEEIEQKPTDPPPPTNTPAPTNTPSPTNTPEPMFSNPGMITEKDYATDFSFSEGWYDFYISPETRPDYSLTYEGDQAVLRVETKDTYVYMIQDDLYYYEGEPVYVEATIEVTDGPYDNNLGVVCRVSDEGWYEYLIRSGGNWELYLYDSDDGYKWLDTGATYAINMKHAENTIGMLCDGDEITLFVNGENVKTVYNDEMDEGTVGLNVGTLEYGGSVFEIKSFYAINDMSMLNLPN